MRQARAKLLSRRVGIALVCGLSLACSRQQPAYNPGAGENWAQRPPAALGVNPAKLEKAIAFAQANKTPWPMDPKAAILQRFADDPYSKMLGPTKMRGDMNGIVVKNGYIIYEFGDTRRVDMTFSATKSFLSTCAGLALAEGLIRDLHEPVQKYVHTGQFDSARNAPITWHHLLQQTSEWQGILWDKPDVADRRKGRERTLQPPGTFWEYNDVRVNLLAFALLQVWRRPLPDVLKEKIMDPIGASDTWQWHGYENSYVEIDGRRMQSVSGGGHWGGGMWISTRDMARFGLLFLRRGRWGDRQLLPASWIDRLTTPCDIQPEYGYMWWLNTDGREWPDAPHDSFAALGAGMNFIWIYPKADLVVVMRWIDRNKVNEFLKMLVAALDGERTG